MWATAIVVALAAVASVHCQSNRPPPAASPGGDFEQLKLVIMMFRHGARAPEKTFPTDQYQNEDWPQGFSELLTPGMRMQYELGKQLRERYISTTYPGFMDASYNAAQIRVTSTPLNRTIMSAQSQLAGWFPPSRSEQFDLSIAWQPIPVHSQPINIDPLLKYNLCPYYHVLSYCDQDDPDYQALTNDPANQELFTYLESKTGLTTVNLDNLLQVQDPIYVESQIPGYHTPEWLRAADPSANPPRPISDFDRINSLYDFVQGLTSNNFEKQSITIAPFYKLVIRHIDDFIASTTTPGAGLPLRKAYLYSGHDATVAPALNALGIWDHINPDYASAFFIEVFFGRYGGTYDHRVKFFYRKGNKDARILQKEMPSGCADPLSCTLDEFRLKVKPLTDSDFQTQCNRHCCDLARATKGSTHIECFPLADIANGRVRMNGTGVDAVAEYTCDQGYVLVGKSQRICQQVESDTAQTMAVFTEQEPSCVKMNAAEEDLFNFASNKQELAAAGNQRSRLSMNQQADVAAERQTKLFLQALLAQAGSPSAYIAT